jgi:hypothetical protein
LAALDESTFHQFIFSKKQWKGPNGKAFLMPKSDGEIYMVSVFTASEFGLGPGSQLKPAIYNEINESHQQNKPYMPMGDAELVKGLPIKTELKDSYDLSLTYFRTGDQHEGYWNSSQPR